MRKPPGISVQNFKLHFREDNFFQLFNFQIPLLEIIKLSKIKFKISQQDPRWLLLGCFIV